MKDLKYIDMCGNNSVFNLVYNSSNIHITPSIVNPVEEISQNFVIAAYAGDELGPTTDNNPGLKHNFNSIKESGFNTIYLGLIHITPSGDLVFNDISLVQNSSISPGIKRWSSLLTKAEKQLPDINNINIKDNYKLAWSFGGGSQIDLSNILPIL